MVDPEPLGTAGAIKNAEGLLDDAPFLVLNGDILTDLDLGAVMRVHGELGAEGVIALTPVEDPSAFGLVRLHDDASVEAFVEKPRPDQLRPGEPYRINAGTYLLSPSVLDEIPLGRACSIEREVFPVMAERGTLYGFPSDAYWRDIGTPASYLAAHHDVLDGALETESPIPGPYIGPGAEVDERGRGGRPLVPGPGRPGGGRRARRGQRPRRGHARGRGGGGRRRHPGRAGRGGRGRAARPRRGRGRRRGHRPRRARRRGRPRRHGRDGGLTASGSLRTVYGLDGPDALQADSLGLIRGVADSVAAFDEARAAAEAAEIPWPADEVDSVAVCGMGGSAIAADLILGAYRERMRVPYTVVRDYYIPGWIGERTLVILSSYSGGTEETLTAASQALERNALCVAITSGGKLAQFYGPEGVPVIPVRPGLQPRAALLRLLVPMLVVLDRMGVIGNTGSDLEEARGTLVGAISQMAPDVPEPGNPAKQLARALSGSIPLLWGAELTAPVAVRWKGQFNENAKMPAYASALPELDHNEICGFAGHARRARPPREAGDAARPAPPPPDGAALRPHPRAGRAEREPGAVDHRGGPEPARPDARPGDARRLRLALRRAAARG